MSDPLCTCPRCQIKHGRRSEATVTISRETVDRLREALLPFGYQAKIIDSEDEKHREDGKRHDSASFRFDGSFTHIVLGDCRRAAEALADMARVMEGVR